MSDKHKIGTRAMMRSIREEKPGIPDEIVLQSMKPLIQELNELGFNVETLADLRHQSRNYRDQIPLLVSWLRKIENTGVKEEIVRCLTMKNVPSIVGETLIEEFKKSSDELFKWTIGNALSETADESVLSEMLRIAEDTRHGRSRQMIIVGLARFPDPAVYDALLRLLKDDNMCGHALMALGKLAYSPARDALVPFLKHEKTWIRNKAKQAIAVIDRKIAKSEKNRVQEASKWLH